MGLADLRDTLDEKKPIVIGAAGLLILLSIVYLVVSMFTGGGNAPGTKATLIYFDVAGQKVQLVDFDASSGELPATPLTAGAEVFLASVWYCGDSSDAKLSDGMALSELEAAGLFIAWLEKVDPNGAVNEFGTRPMLYRTLSQPKWVKAETAQSLAIIESPYDKCPDAKRYSIR